MKKQLIARLTAVAIAAFCIVAVNAESVLAAVSTGNESGVSGNIPGETPDKEDPSISGNVPGETPDIPENPETPETPDTPETPETPDAEEPSVSGNLPSTPSAPTSPVAPAAPAVSSTVTAEAGHTSVVAGKRVVNTVGGVYAAQSINGMAVTTPIADVALAAGLSEADVAAGTNVRFYVCDSRNTETKKALTSYITESGKKVVAFVNADLYTITKKGVVSKVRTTAEPITMVFGLPGRFVNESNSFSIVCFDADGNAVIMEDMDTDARTITVNAKNFGTFAIVY